MKTCKGCSKRGQGAMRIVRKAEEERPSNKGFKGNAYLADMFLELLQEKKGAK